MSRTTTVSSESAASREVTDPEEIHTDTDKDTDAQPESESKESESKESTNPESANDEPSSESDESSGSDHDEDAAPPSGPGTRNSAVSGRFRRGGLVVASLVSVAALALLGWFGWQYKTDHATDSAASAALDTARDYAVTLTSVSADSIDEDFTAVLDGATGEFKSMYAKSSEQLRQLLVDNQANAEGKVIASGIESASPSKVVVLLFVDQSVRNASTPEPRIDRSRVEMTMERVDDRWLAAKVELP
ncbi:hypothetical protein VZC37_03810 [Gordonia sp. LSe1-13]|uniref:Mce protein n=1 Tax=Gordonia sesuvii TaxID=3116777 RepID=A0ABU7M8N3_9ACTN|nr:hypothetical protein [Gordonia sp. LSe1-13]